MLAGAATRELLEFCYFGGKWCLEIKSLSCSTQLSDVWNNYIVVDSAFDKNGYIEIPHDAP